MIRGGYDLEIKITPENVTPPSPESDIPDDKRCDVSKSNDSFTENENHSQGVQDDGKNRHHVFLEGGKLFTSTNSTSASKKEQKTKDLFSGINVTLSARDEEKNHESPQEISSILRL